MHSIRTQFISFIVALLLVLLLLLNTYPLISSRDAIFEEKRSSMTGQAATVAASLSSLERRDGENIAEVLRYLDISGYSRVVVTDLEGLVLYDNGGETGGRTDLEDVFTCLEGKTVFRSSFSEEAFNSSLAIPLSAKGDLTGALYLAEHDPERAEIILGVQKQIRVASLAIGALALVLAFLFVFLLLQRLRALMRSMRVVADGDYSYRHTVRGRDEIAVLGEEFNQLTERLQTTEQQRRRFVSDASHELKTPLASIRLLADSIVQNESMDMTTVREFVSDIDSEAKRLQRTTEKLLDLSRLDDDVSIVPEPVDVGAVPVGVVDLELDELHLRVGRQHGVQMLRRVVHGEAEMLDQALFLEPVHKIPDAELVFNLVENAIKYNVPAGSVDIELRGDEQSVRLTVTDTGIGIPEEDRLNIFSRFYRVDKARSREAGGSGLGLSIVHDAVLAHGGSISVGQNKPQGSVFIVSFPRPTSEETGI